MGPVKVDPAKVHEFATAARIYRWLGKHHTAETKIKIGINNLGKNAGKKHSAEARAKMSLARRGKKFTEEHRKHLTEALTRRWKKARV